MAISNTVMTMFSTLAQLGFLVLAAGLGFAQASPWWLLPLTIVLGVVGWLTDSYWKIRFYDIYSMRMWARFWSETLFGLICLMFAAYVVGRIARAIATYAALVA